MIYSGTDKAFRWRDYSNVQALSNVTVQGFLAAIEGTFEIDTPSSISLDTRLQTITLWSAIHKKLLDEPTMDIVARQFNFPAWEYVGRFNVAPPFDTILKRKQEMLKQVVKLMRYRGTPYSVEQSLLAFGFTNVIIHENVTVTLLYDGTYKYNGLVPYSGTMKHQLFSVELTTTLDLIAPAGSPDEQLDAIVSIVNNFKKLRPELYQVIAHTPSVPLGDTRQIWGA